MRRAIDLAFRGWGRVHPNPLVGAVVLGAEGAVGEGYHGEFGGPHAETIALAAAGDRARGGTLVVSLEPCRHPGKQPPCVERIVAAGIRRVVFAAEEPNPIAAGGASALRDRGVVVEPGPLREQAERQNAAYLHAVRDSTRPFVVVKLATSLDHKIADSAGRSRWISGEEARDFVHWHRAGFDAIAVGGRTALVDDPSLTVRGPVEPRIPPRRVVFLGSRRLPLDATLVRLAREIPTIAVLRPAAAEAAALRDAGVEVFAARSLGDALERLRERGIASIVIEGGGRLVGSLLAEGLVDRFTWIVSPIWLGDQGVPATRGIEVSSLLEAERWALVDRKGLGQDTLLVFDRR
jgi:diaminohydroxyphosphoribosylaminopyrimidine deaminase/5-amino-6-(5-phosphoribosylamino)uracil reductase